MNILGIVGSLRKGSYNRLLMNAFVAQKPEGVEVEIADIDSVPLYNDDLIHEFPSAVQTLKEKIESADALIIATPEYNRSIPGVLKNTIDWCTRPRGENSFVGKRTFITGAATGKLGTAVAQYDLKRILLHERAQVLWHPEIFVDRVESKFDNTGNLIDAEIKEQIEKAWLQIVAM